MAANEPELQQDLLHRVLTVSRHLGASTDLNEILAVIIDTMRDGLDAERATVFEYDPKADELFTFVAHGFEREAGEDYAGGTREIRIPATKGIAGDCVQQRAIINVPDAYDDPRFNREVDKQTGFRTRSVLAIPLITHDNELAGVAQVLNKRGGAFTDEDEQIASALAAHAAIAMKRGRLIEDRLVREKLERDLALAREIQQSTFPTELPYLEDFDLAAWSEPADQTGGDAYDIIGLRGAIADAAVNAGPATNGNEPASRAYLLMADATGHGVGPALSATQVRSMLRMGVRIGAGLSDIARHMNEQLGEDLPPGRFVTTWFGELNVAESTLSTLSAGQAPLFWYHAAEQTFEDIPADTVPLGVLDDLDVDSPRTIKLQPGDLFIVFSDGIYEAAPEQRTDQFGTDRTLEIIRAHAGESAAAIIDAVRDAVMCFTGGIAPDDDRTAIVLKRLAESEC